MPVSLLKNKKVIKVPTLRYEDYDDDGRSFYLSVGDNNMLGVASSEYYALGPETVFFFEADIDEFIDAWQRVVYDDREDSTRSVSIKTNYNQAIIQKGHGVNRVRFTAPCGQTVVLRKSDADEFVGALLKLEPR